MKKLTMFCIGIASLSVQCWAGNLTVDGDLMVNSNLTAESISLGTPTFLALQGYKYVVVSEGTNDIDRGNNLRAAYSIACGLNPASTNRVAVIIPPGNHNLNGTGLDMSTNYVDLIGLVPAQMTTKQVFTDVTGVKRTKTVAQVHCPVCIYGAFVSQSAGDVHFESLIISNYIPYVASTNTLLRHIAMTTMRADIDYAGEYIDCVGGSFSFGCDQDSHSDAKGTFIDCVAGNNSFGGSDDGRASGTFVDCTGSNECFGGAYSAVVSGTFIRCVAGDDSFGGSGGVSTASGSFIDCVAGARSFGCDGVLASTAKVRDCAAGADSFGNFSGSNMDDFNYHPGSSTVFDNDVEIEGKLNLNGGMDPPYLLLDSETRDSIATRVSREVPPGRQTGAALYWNVQTERLEIYVASKGTYYDLAGTLLTTITAPVVTNATVTASYRIDPTMGTAVLRETLHAPRWQLKPGYRFNSSTGVFTLAGNGSNAVPVTAQEALEYK